MTSRTERTVRAVLVPGLAMLLALVLAVTVGIAMPIPAYAIGVVAPLDAWPATPQMTATTGNLAGTFSVSAGTNRVLVVLVCDYDSGGSSGQTFTASYGGKTLTQAFLQNSNLRQTWIGYLKEADIASRTGNAITVTVTGTHTQVRGYIASYSGVDQTTPITAASGAYINNVNNQPIGGPLNIDAGGYGIYGWSGTAGRTRTSDTETYTEHSDVNNPLTFNYGVASKAFAAAGTTNPLVTWSGNNRVSVSFITLNPDSYPVPTTTGISPTTKTVGDPDFTLTVDGTDFVSGVSVVRLDGADRATTFVSSTQLTAMIPAGDLTTAGDKTITVFTPAPGGGTSNFQILTVDKATPTITWADPSDIVYGTALSSTQLCATASVPGTFVYTPDFGALLLAGNSQPLHVAFTPTDTANYSNASADVTINVNKAGLTITADDRGKAYGDTVSFLGTEFTTTGLVGSDNVTSVSLTSTGVGASAAVGTYDIVVSAAVGIGLDNYDITYENGTLTVMARDIEVTADDNGKTYGDSDPSLTYQITSGSLVGSDAFTGSIARETGEDVGTYDIQQGSLALSSNYSLTFLDGTFTISAQDIEVTADDNGKTYGEADPALTYQITSGSLVGSDVFSGSIARQTGENASAYDIQQGTLTLGSNYSLTFIEGVFTITARGIAVTADDNGKTYGEADPALTYRITSGSLVGSDAFSGAIARQVGENVGTYDIQQGTLVLNGNYNLTFMDGTFTIDPKALTITAYSRSKLCGDMVTFYGTEFVVIGLDAGDSVTSVTLISAGAPGAIGVGDYPIVPSAAVGTGLSKYSITYVDGTLTVHPKALSIAANSRSKTYGEMVIFAGNEFTTNGLLNGDSVTSVTLISTGADVANAVGTYDIVASNAVGTGLDNYNIIYVNGSLTVNKVSVGLSLSSSVSTSREGKTITFTATVTGTEATGTVTFEDGGATLGSSVLCDGTATYTISTLPIGSHSITAVYSGDANFTGSTSSAVDLSVKTAAGLSWALIGGLIAAAVLIGLFFLLLILRRRRKHPSNTNVASRGTQATVAAAGKNHGDADSDLRNPASSGPLAGGEALTSSTALPAIENVGTYSIQLERELEGSLQKVQETMEAAIQAISHTVAIRDPYVASHQKRVSELACAIAGEMGLTAWQIDGVRVAGLLHDIGKITVPTEILSKPGKLSPAEISLIKDHPKVAYDILKNVKFDWPIAQIVVQHHERMDGSGYPYGLAGKDILIEARILAVADVVEAMCTDRPYRPALGIEDALAELAVGYGILYDSEVVAACKRVFNERGFKIELDSARA